MPKSDNKKSLARALFLSGMEMGEIAGKMDVSRVTVSRWCAAEGWKEARAARNVTRPELINKLLLNIDNLLEQGLRDKDPAAIAGLADKLSKLASVIEKLDRKDSVVDRVNTFINFCHWLERRADTDPDVTPELIKRITRLQDLYIIGAMGENPD